VTVKLIGGPLVPAGFGVSLVPQSIEQIHADGIVYTRIEGEAPMAPIGLAYRRDNRSATVRNFVALPRKRGTAFRAQADVTLAAGWTTVALP
jgi:DNA-binding transcriptional LysR family regulator